MSKTVLILLSSYGFHTEAEIAGIMRFARTVGWNVRTLECGRAALSRYTKPRNRPLAHVEECLRLWNPDGLIVSPDVAPYALTHPGLKRLAKVFWDSYPGDMPKGTSCVHSDADRVAQDAVEELAKLGFPYYAFVPFDATSSWSIARGAAFSRKVAVLGFGLCTFDTAVPPSSVVRHRAEILRFVKSLPRPCAVFAANDLAAERIMAACESLGVSVPTEVAVLGVDDDANICENTHPTLSSIRSDYEAGGYRAAELLAELMRNPRACGRVGTFGTLGVTRRMSTRRFLKDDCRVRKALEYIRLHACEGIGVDDAVAQLDCGRRRAEMLFRKELGRSILDCIHEVRIANAQRMMRNPHLKQSVISDACGYASAVDMRRVFKRLTGLTPVGWRMRLR